MDHIADVYEHHLENNSSDKIIINLGTDKDTTYFDFVSDVAKSAGLDSSLIHPDGEEAYWPQNSTLALEKAALLGYPQSTYEIAVSTIAKALKEAN